MANARKSKKEAAKDDQLLESDTNSSYRGDFNRRFKKREVLITDLKNSLDATYIQIRPLKRSPKEPVLYLRTVRKLSPSVIELING